MTRELLKEAALLGACGAVVGLPLDVWMAQEVAPRMAVVAGLVHGVTVPPVDVPLRILPLLVAAGLGIAVALVAAVVPARRAARAPVSVVVGARGVEGIPEEDRRFKGPFARRCSERPI